MNFENFTGVPEVCSCLEKLIVYGELLFLFSFFIHGGKMAVSGGPFLSTVVALYLYIKYILYSHVEAIDNHNLPFDCT